MKLRLVLILLLLWNNLVSQTYELLNQITPDSVNLHKEFESWEKVGFFLLEEQYFEDQWMPLYSDKIPSFEEFTDNVNLNRIKSFAKKETQDFEIKSNLLTTKPYLVDYEDLKSGRINSFLLISKPVFNKAKDFALIYRTGVFSPGLDVGTSGNIYIYRKINGVWKYYHKILVWMS